jgi:hypothetical protein
MSFPLEKTFLPQRYIGVAIEKPVIPDAIRNVAEAHDLIEKTSVHISVAVERNAQTIWKAIAAAENPEETMRTLETVFKKYVWEYALTDEYFLHERMYTRDVLVACGFPNEEEHLTRSIVQKAVAPDLSLFYAEVNTLLGTSMEVPVPHTTLFTWSDYEPVKHRGIGICSAKEFEECTKEVLDSQGV